MRRPTATFVKTFVTMVILMTVSLGITFYILLNSAELLLGVDLPLANSISTVPVETFVAANRQPNTNPTDVGSFGAPAFVKLGTQKIRIQTVPAIVKGDSYLARAAASHYILLSGNKEGNLGNVFLYLRQSWRTARQEDAPSVGQNVFLDTLGDWRYMYRISEVTTLPYGAAFISPDSQTGTFTLALIDESNQQITYITADFVTLQNIAL